MMMPTATATSLPEPTQVGSHRIQFADTLCELLIDQTLVRFSALEYAIVQVLLARHDRYVPYRCLLAFASETLSTERVPLRHARTRLARATSKIRSKIWPCGLDIACVMGRGYVLLSSTTDDDYMTEGAITR